MFCNKMDLLKKKLIRFALGCGLFVYIVYISAPFLKPSKPVRSEDKLINLNSFKYLLERNCSFGGASIVLIVTSFAGNIDARNAIRNAYNQTELNKLNIFRVFLLASLKSGQSRLSQEDLVKENGVYGDIVQGNFYESYRNLTYKHVMGLKWASSCDGVKYIVKMDDDVVVDLYRLVEVISRQKEITLMGYVLEEQKVMRDAKSKWYVPKRVYSGDIYPTFLSGWLYVTTRDVASDLVSASLEVPFFWIDDVYVTGILAERIKVGHQSVNPLIAPFTEFLMCCIRDRLLCGFVAGPTNGYYAFQGLFKRLTDKCRQGLCRPIPDGKSLKDYCTVDWKVPVDMGRAEVRNIYL